MRNGVVPLCMHRTVSHSRGMHRAVRWTAFTDARGVSKGMGFARFEFTREATAAIDALNNQRVVFVDHSSTLAALLPPVPPLLASSRVRVLSCCRCLCLLQMARSAKCRRSSVSLWRRHLVRHGQASAGRCVFVGAVTAMPT